MKNLFFLCCSWIIQTLSVYQVLNQIKKLFLCAWKLLCKQIFFCYGKAENFLLQLKAFLKSYGKTPTSRDRRYHSGKTSCHVLTFWKKKVEVRLNHKEMTQLKCIISTYALHNVFMFLSSKSHSLLVKKARTSENLLTFL